jgi:hypothetical protein
VNQCNFRPSVDHKDASMTDILSENAPINELQKKGAALGLTLRGDAGRGLSGEMESI